MFRSLFRSLRTRSNQNKAKCSRRVRDPRPRWGFAWGFELLEDRTLPSAILPGFDAYNLGHTDDGSTGAVSLGFTANFLGRSFSQIYINNNGNCTFDGPMSTYNPFPLGSSGREILAPFFADVDTRTSNTVSYGPGTVDGHLAFGVNWPGVGFYRMHNDRLNYFQLVLVDRSDIAPGDFDIEYNYNQIQWESSDSSGGALGLGGQTARVGWSNGSGLPGTSFELAGSGVAGSFLDNGFASTSLINNDLGSTVLGRYVWHAWNGTVTTNTPPTVTAPANQSASEGASQAFTLGSFTDTSPGPWTVNVSWGDGTPNTTFSTSALGSLGAANHTFAEEGNPTVTVTVTNGVNLSATESFQVAVGDAGLTGTPQSLSANEGQGLSNVLVATFTDPGTDGTGADYGATVTWDDGGGASHTSTGRVQWISGTTFGVYADNTVPYAEEGNHAVTVQVTDVGGSSTNASSTVAVSDPAVVAGSGFTVSAVEGSASASQTVATFTDPGGAEAVGDYGATISWGDGSSSAGTVSYNAATGQFAVSGSHSYAEEGSYGISVAIMHDNAPAVSVTSSANVADGPLSASGGFTVSAVEGSASASQTLATFSDAGGAEALGEYSATVTWGDGSSSTGTVSYNAATGQFTVSGSHAYAEEGSYAVTVQVTDVGGSSATVSSSAAVSDPAVIASGGFTVSAVEGSAFAGQAVATFTDPGGAEAVGDYGATVNWGDGSSSAGTVSYNTTTGQFTVSGNHSYAEEGSYGISVAISHDNAPSVTVSGSASVGDAPLSATGRSVTAVAGAPFSGVVASFTDPNAQATVGEFTATISWGDGRTSVGTVTANGSGGFEVTGSHTYAAVGSDAVTVQVSDVGGSTVTAAATAQVVDPVHRVGRGQSATVDFWHSRKGQALIDSFNGGPRSTALANWLAATLPNLYGVNAGAHNLAGKTSAEVAAFYQSLWRDHDQKLGAQVLDTALDVYATTASLGGTTAAKYGFVVAADGLGTASCDVGHSGAAFGVHNGTTLNVYQILQAVDQRAAHGVLYHGNRRLDRLANEVFERINRAGHIH